MKTSFFALAAVAVALFLTVGCKTTEDRGSSCCAAHGASRR